MVKYIVVASARYYGRGDQEHLTPYYYLRQGENGSWEYPEWAPSPVRAHRFESRELAARALGLARGTMLSGVYCRIDEVSG